MAGRITRSSARAASTRRRCPRSATSCRPAATPATWSADRTRHAERGDQYAARHDGFAFFQSVTANLAFCAAQILAFQPLPGDLTRASVTTAFSFLLAPNLCNDGHDAPCADRARGGLAQADRFLARWVPVIIATPAHRDG